MGSSLVDDRLEVASTKSDCGGLLCPRKRQRPATPAAVAARPRRTQTSTLAPIAIVAGASTVASTAEGTHHGEPRRTAPRSRCAAARSGEPRARRSRTAHGRVKPGLNESTGLSPLAQPSLLRAEPSPGLEISTLNAALPVTDRRATAHPRSRPRAPPSRRALARSLVVTPSPSTSCQAQHNQAR